MGRIALFIIMVALSNVFVINAHESTETDTITDRKLREVTVTARKSEYIAPGVMKITPMPTQKRLASTAAQLLANMNMAMFKVNENDQTVSLANGQGVKVFINGRAAGKEELKGFRPAMVRYMLVLDNPEDAKYGGAQHVIDYIMREETGGYAKLGVAETFLNGSEFDGDIYTKYNSGKITYSLFVNGWRKTERHGGVMESETMRLADDNFVSRVSDVTSYKKNSWSVPFTGKLSYSSKRFMMDQTLGYSHDSYPTSLEVIGKRNYGLGTAASDYTEGGNAQSNNVRWNSWYYFMFPKAYSLSVSTVLDHSHNRSLTTYNGPGAAFENRAQENSYIYSVTANATKRFGTKHILRLMAGYMFTRSVIDYHSSSNTEYGHPSYDATLNYMFMLPSFNFSVSGGFNHMLTNTNGVRTKHTIPAVSADLGVRTGKTSRLSGYFQYKTGATGATVYNSEIIRWDEMKYLTGDPNIATERRMMAGVSWNWNPNNSFSLFPYVNYSGIFDRIMLVYSPYGDGLLMQWQNVGNFKRMETGVSTSYSMAKGKLSVSATPKMLNFFSVGTTIRSYNAFAMDLGAMMMVGNFRLTANWGAVQKSMDDDGATNRLPSRFDAGASWMKGAWSISLKLSNPFRSNWKAGSKNLTTRYYDYAQVNYGIEYHRSCMVTASYTFDYGKKKVDHVQEVRREAYSNSAILKK